MNLKDYVRDVPDFPKPGILFKDITPLLSSPEAFRSAIEQLAARYEKIRVDAIAAAEARGFLLAAPLAYLLKKPLIPLRKPGKLPYQTTSFSYDLEYGSASLHMHVDAFSPGEAVLLVDDVLATGGTMQAAC
ncbi:MAG TPA: adenine phosphoribosyltransferase, partial [Gemmatales bacterium]|nr:adenine phosphoribosyltransferase [Gemmatales bacterium]